MRKLNYWHLCLAIWLGIASLSCAQNKATFELKEDEKLIDFTTYRFTLPNLHVTPNGKNIIFDVLGDIYQVPIEGGKAKVLLQDNNWNRGAKLSPDGKTLAYVSDETGDFQVWTLDLKTKEKRVYPIKEYAHYPLEAYWKDEGNLLIPNKVGLQSFEVSTGKSKIVRSALQEERSVLDFVNRTMSVNKIGEYAFFQKSGDLWAYNVDKEIDLLISSIPNKDFTEYFKASANGKKLLYYREKVKGESKQELISWDLITNDKKIINTTEGFGIFTSLNHSFDFIDDSTIILEKEGLIVRMNIETGKYEPIPIEVEVKKVIKKPLRREPQYIRDSIINASVLRNPVTRKDLDTIYFGAFGKLHSYAKHTQEITEVYPKEDRFEVSPNLSPDGKYLAYTTWNDTKMGHLYVREIKTGKEYQVTQTAGMYINPAWSPDSTEIMFIADGTEAKLGIPRQSGGANTRNYHLDIHQIEILKNNIILEKSKSDIIYRVYPFSILPRRFYPIPVYHPSGKSIFITTQNNEKDLPVLIEVDLEIKEVEEERLIPFHTDEVVISPDGHHVAFIFDEQVWVDSFPHALKLDFSELSEYAPKQLYYEGGIVDNIVLSEAKSVYEVAPSYLYWQDKHTLMWGSAEEVYTYDVRTGTTEKIADIKVQRLRAVPKTKYALINARIITMNKQEEIIEKGIILVKDNRIEKVGEVEKIVIPENYKVFDLEGKTIMPGLIDVHAHYHHFPYEFKMQQNYKYVGSLAYGVTTIYDPHSNTLDYREQAQLVEIGKTIGPRVFSSGNIIYPYPTNASYYTLFTQDDADRAVRSFSKLGVFGPIKDYMISNPKQKKMLYDAANHEGFTITTDQNKYLSNIKTVLLGYTAFEHSLRTIIQKDVVKAISFSGINFTPTYVATPGIGNIYNNYTDTLKLKSLAGDILFYNKYDSYYGIEVDSIQDRRKDRTLEINKRSIEELRKLSQNKAMISVGGHGDPLPGIGTHWEIWFMTQAMSNYEVLKAATMNGAEKLDLQEEIGSLEAGKLADMVVLNENPLEYIYNTTNIFRIILNGNIYRENDIIEGE